MLLETVQTVIFQRPSLLCGVFGFGKMPKCKLLSILSYRSKKCRHARWSMCAGEHDRDERIPCSHYGDQCWQHVLTQTTERRNCGFYKTGKQIFKAEAICMTLVAKLVVINFRSETPSKRRRKNVSLAIMPIKHNSTVSRDQMSPASGSGGDESC